MARTFVRQIHDKNLRPIKPHVEKIRSQASNQLPLQMKGKNCETCMYKKTELWAFKKNIFNMVP